MVVVVVVRVHEISSNIVDLGLDLAKEQTVRKTLLRVKQIIELCCLMKQIQVNIFFVCEYYYRFLKIACLRLIIF